MLCRKTDINEQKYTVDRIPKSTKLMKYILEETSITKIQKLLKHPDIDLNIQNETGLTALMYAVTPSSPYGDPPHLDVINLLIKYGADVNLQDSAGNTALMLLTKLDESAEVWEGMRVLINAGAELDIQNNNGDTALMLSIDDEPKLTASCNFIGT